MKYLLLTVIFALVLSGCATTKHEKEIITGEFTWNQWQQQAGWHDYDAAEYEPGDFLIGQLSSLVKDNDITFLLFAGSWCGDSESEVPKIFKLFGKAGIPLDKIKLFGVDRDKREPSGVAEVYNIQRVPTLIVLKAGKEVGRIVEFPETSWEEDIFKILIKN